MQHMIAKYMSLPLRDANKGEGTPSNKSENAAGDGQPKGVVFVRHLVSEEMSADLRRALEKLEREKKAALKDLKSIGMVYDWSRKLLTVTFPNSVEKRQKILEAFKKLSIGTEHPSTSPLISLESQVMRAPEILCDEGGVAQFLQAGFNHPELKKAAIEMGIQAPKPRGL